MQQVSDRFASSELASQRTMFLRGRSGLATAAELDDAAAVALGRTAFWQGRELLHGFAFSGFAPALFLAGIGFAVEGLGNGGGTTDIAQLQDFDMKFAAFVADAEHVANADIAGRLGFDLIGMDAAEIAGL